MQMDPTGFDAGDMNLYCYCDDDPVDGSDPTGLLADHIYERQVWLYGSNFQGSFDDFEQQRHPAGTDGGERDVTMAGQSRTESRQLMSLPPDVVKKLWETNQTNAEQASNRANWTDIPGRKEKRQEEYSTTIYRGGRGLSQIGPTQGRHINNQPQSPVFGPYLKDGSRRVAADHIHVSGNGRHYGVDVDRAKEGRFISGVGHVSNPALLNIYVPPRFGNGPGAFFHTTDGMHLIPLEQ